MDDETAFGGDKPGTGPRWWYYGEYKICCPDGPPPVDVVCQTAFAKGGWVFVTDARANPERLPSLNLIRNRWGWAINLQSTGTFTYDLWAGAGLNNTANGTKVGTVTVNFTGLQATVTYTLVDPATMKELHIYAGDLRPTTVAPGQYGYIEYFDPPATTHTATFDLGDSNGDGIWIIAHAVSCVPVTK